MESSAIHMPIPASITNPSTTDIIMQEDEESWYKAAEGLPSMAQYASLVIIFNIGASLSVVGSACIVYMTSRKIKQDLWVETFSIRDRGTESPYYYRADATWQIHIIMKCLNACIVMQQQQTTLM